MPLLMRLLPGTRSPRSAPMTSYRALISRNLLGSVTLLSIVLSDIVGRVDFSGYSAYTGVQVRFSNNWTVDSAIYCVVCWIVLRTIGVESWKSSVFELRIWRIGIYVSL